MKVQLTLGLLVAVCVGTSSQSYAAEPFQVLRPGDQDLACEDLASEVNRLTAAAQAKAKRADSGRKMMGFASGAMSSALPLLGGGRGMGGSYAAQAAMSAMQQGQMASQMNQPTEAPAGPSPEQSRADHLQQIFASKSC